MGLPLVTLQDYKSYKGISGTTEDAQINQIIPKVSELVKSLCRRSFVDYAQADLVQVFDGGYSKLILSEAPVISVTSLETSTDYGATYTNLIDKQDYLVDKSGYVLCLWPGKIWHTRLQGYKITYRAGYITLPEDLKLATLDLVTFYLKNHMAMHTARAPGASTVQIEYTVSNKLPTHIQRVIDQYVYEVS